MPRTPGILYLVADPTSISPSPAIRHPFIDPLERVEIPVKIRVVDLDSDNFLPDPDPILLLIDLNEKKTFLFIILKIRTSTGGKHWKAKKADIKNSFTK